MGKRWETLSMSKILEPIAIILMLTAVGMMILISHHPLIIAITCIFIVVIMGIITGFYIFFKKPDAIHKFMIAMLWLFNASIWLFNYLKICCCSTQWLTKTLYFTYYIVIFSLYICLMRRIIPTKKGSYCSTSIRCTSSTSR